MSDRIAVLDYSPRSFREPLEALLQRLEADGLPMRVFESARSPSRQDALYAQGRDPSAPDYGRTVTRARAYQSAHQWALGADIVFYVGDGWTWDEPEAGMWSHFLRLVPTFGLESLSFEKPHVQLAGFDWRQMQPGPQDVNGWLQWLTVRAEVEAA